MKKVKRVKRLKVKRLIMERKKVKLMTGMKKNQRLTMLQLKIVSSYKEVEEISFDKIIPRLKLMRL